MKDERGLYYYPAPQNTRIRMYVREQFGTVEFRMHDLDKPEFWERHGWIPYEEIEMAAAHYKENRRGADPMALYDLNVAQRLIVDEGPGASATASTPASS